LSTHLLGKLNTYTLTICRKHIDSRKCRRVHEHDPITT